MNRFNHPVLRLLLAFMIFGMGAAFVTFIAFDPVVIAFYRLLIGAVFFGAILFFQRQPLRINLSALTFASIGGIMLGIDLGLWNQSIRSVGPGIATILNSLQVFFMAGCAMVFYKKKPNRSLSISLCVTFIGVVLLCSNELNTNDSGTRGVITGIASALAFAISMIAIREAAKYQKNSLLNTMFYASIAGSLAMGVFVFFSGRSLVPSEASSWFTMLLYGSIVHVLAWYMMASAMPKLEVTVVGLIACSEPVTVVFVDLIFLDKYMTPWQLFGALLTVTAILIGSQSGKASKKLTDVTQKGCF